MSVQRHTTRRARIAAVQPPIAAGAMALTDLADTTRAAAELAAEALDERGADLVVLPELLNVFGLAPEQAAVVADDADGFLSGYLELSARHPDAVLVVPVLERRDGALYNASVVVQGGRRRGAYDKTHLALAEEAGFEDLRAGDTYPVFDTPFGRIGIMTCYDAYFPEVARIYAGHDVDVLCYPSWQSGPSELWFDVQLRCRALDNALVLVRSSFGYRHDVAWKPGMFFGRSAVVDRDGTILSDIGHAVGLALADVDLDRRVLMDILDDGGNVQDLRELMFAQRRPDTYGALLSTWRPPVDARALMAAGAQPPRDQAQ